MASTLESFGITKAVIELFNTNVQSVAEQRERRFGADKSRVERIEGLQTFFNWSKKRSMSKITSRNPDTPIGPDQDYIRRSASPSWYDDGVLFDPLVDPVVTFLSDPTSYVVSEMANARNRTYDSVFLDAAFGPAVEQTGAAPSDTTVVPFPTSQVIEATPSTNLTLAKLIAIKQKLWETDDDSLISGAEKIYIALTQTHLSQLLANVDSVANYLYNDVRALVDGKVNNFMGMTFVYSELLKNYAVTPGSDIPVLAWAPRAIVQAPKTEKVEVFLRPDKSQGIQVLSRIQAGAVRGLDDLVVRANCTI